MHLAYDVLITMNVRFYSRQNDLTLSALMSRLETAKAEREKHSLAKKLATEKYKTSLKMIADWKQRRATQ